MALPSGIVPALGRALATRGFETLTPVQDAVLEPGLQAADLIVSAQTGSGKTVAFGLTLAANLLDGAERFGAPGAPLGLVIAPTRELALQVKRELDWLYAEAGARVVSCVGGMDARAERITLERGAHIVVGTPGRLVDHIRREALQMGSLRGVVLDEADEMMNLGFREELEHILDASPAERRTLMFSATMPRAIETLARTYMRDAVRVNTVSDQSQHLDIEYKALVVGNADTENAVFNVLRHHDAPTALVFCGTRAAVSRLASRFANRGFSVVAMSGDLSQNERTHALQALRDHRARICVATDVAARGIDLPDLDLVIHAELPKNTEALLHRSGRTGRAGRKGTSVLIVPQKARRHVERFLRNANIDATWGAPPSAEDILKRDNERMLADPILSEDVAETEREIVASLMERYPADQIAAAFVRLHQKGKAAPEDLSDATDTSRHFDKRDYQKGSFDKRDRGPRPERPMRDAPGRAQRTDFQDGVWISLNVGRARSAEPRWLIPMLCTAGGLTKKDLGSIRIQETETHIEMTADAVDRFFDAVGRRGKLEQGIIATRLDGMPPAESAAPAPVPAPEAPRRPEGRERPQRADRAERPARAERTERLQFAERPQRSERPERAEWSERPPQKPRPAHGERARAHDGPRPPRRDDRAPAFDPAAERTEPVRARAHDGPRRDKRPEARTDARRPDEARPPRKGPPPSRPAGAAAFDKPRQKPTFQSGKPHPRAASGDGADRAGGDRKPFAGKRPAPKGPRGPSRTPPTNRNKRSWKPSA